MSDVINTLSTIVEISKIVTSSKDFFAIKDSVIDKMLEVVPPKRACVNIFKNNSYEYTYLVCKETLGDIPKFVEGQQSDIGVKIHMDQFAEYFSYAIKNKCYYYVRDIFVDDMAEAERALAEKVGYKGRLVVPLVSSNNVKGFITCFVEEDEELSEGDIDFINSVASLLALSIDITNQNKEIDEMVKKFRNAIVSIESRATVLYENRSPEAYFKLIAEDICKITSSKSAFIFVDDDASGLTVAESYGSNKNIKKVNDFIISNSKNSDKKIYQGDSIEDSLIEQGIHSIAYENLVRNDEKIGKIILINSEKYYSDDIRILGIFATQIILSLYIYLNNVKLLENSFIHRDLELVNQQQKLIMEDEIMSGDDNVSIDYLNIPYKYVGGDFCKFKKIDDNKYIFFIADVMGHGLMSNYFVAIMKGAINMLLTITSSPSTILSQLNSILFKELDKLDIFITAKMIFFDFQNNKVYSANAGHTVPIAIYKDKNGKRKYKMLNSNTAIALGIFEDTVYDEDVTNVNGIEFFAIYTDGVIEAKNKKGEEFGVNRLANYFINQLNNNIENPCDAIKDELAGFTDNKGNGDDITIFTLKRSI